jgi:hypothetical protein
MPEKVQRQVEPCFPRSALAMVLGSASEDPATFPRNNVKRFHLIQFNPLGLAVGDFDILLSSRSSN